MTLPDGQVISNTRHLLSWFSLDRLAFGGRAGIGGTDGFVFPISRIKLILSGQYLI